MKGFTEIIHRALFDSFNSRAVHHVSPSLIVFVNIAQLTASSCMLTDIFVFKQVFQFALPLSVRRAVCYRLRYGTLITQDRCSRQYHHGQPHSVTACHDSLNEGQISLDQSQAYLSFSNLTLYSPEYQCWISVLFSGWPTKNGPVVNRVIFRTQRSKHQR